jgi:hypothetical protein
MEAPKRGVHQYIKDALLKGLAVDKERFFFTRISLEHFSTLRITVHIFSYCISLRKLNRYGTQTACFVPLSKLEVEPTWCSEQFIFSFSNPTERNGSGKREI